MPTTPVNPPDIWPGCNFGIECGHCDGCYAQWHSDRENRIKACETIASEYGSQCGLNADWAVSAWHVGPSETLPNEDSGAIYVLDSEADDSEGFALFEVVARYYEDHDDPRYSDDDQGIEVLGETSDPAELRSLIDTARARARVFRSGRLL